MNLLEIRKKLIELSGNYALVKDVESYEDNGANFYIQAGQRLIDSLLDFPKSRVLTSKELGTGESLLLLPRFRAIQHVWFTADDGIRFLEKLTAEGLEKRFPGDDIDNGLPTHYAISTLRGISGQNEQDQSWNQIKVMVPPDRDITVYISGLYQSDKLVKDSDTSFWSIEYPETLLQAAMYTIERFFRNTQGMNDHMTAIMQDLRNIDADFVEQEITGQAQMNDSFDERLRYARREHGEIW